MLWALLLLSMGAPARHPAEDILARLGGCWRADGQVEGKPVRNMARVQPRLGGRYHLLEVHGLDPDDPYDAAVILAPGKAPDEIVAYWMDSFGGAYSAPGYGKVEDRGLRLTYDYPESVFVNRLVPDGDGWKWTITSRTGPAATESLFASYRLSRAPCDTTPFRF